MMMSPMSGKINFILVLLVSALCLLLGEIALRIIKGFKPTFTGNPYEAYDDTLGWLGIPGYRHSINAQWDKVFYEINDWGFRDDAPLPPELTQGKHRVMFLGDSFVEGYGIDVFDRATNMIKNLDTTVVVYNFGVVGYSTDQELLVLKSFGPRIKPDVVVLFFCMNDLLNNTSNFNYGLSKPRYTLDQTGGLVLQNVPVPKRPALTSMVLWAKDNLATGHYTFNLLNRLTFFHYWIFPGPEGIMDSVIYKPDSLRLYAESSPPREMTRFLLKELKAECERQHAELLIFGTVDGYEVAAFQDCAPEVQRIVLQWARDLGIKAFDLCPLFHKEFSKTHTNFFAGDRYHWNAAGNRLVAQAVLEKLHALFREDSTMTN
jgi:lysophospholipase L1-like esterase